MRADYACVVLILLVSATLFGLSPTAHAGVSFTSPAALNSNAGSDSAHDFTPRIATDRDDTFVVVWASQSKLNEPGNGDFDIFFSRSTNDGAMWSAVTTLNDGATSDSASDQAPDVATDGTTWVVVWSSDRSAGDGDGVDTDIFFSRSTNGGTDWSAATALNTNATGDFADDDFPPRIFTDGNGVWICAWSSEAQLDEGTQLDLDIVFARSEDDGDTWSDPAYLNSNSIDGTAFDVNPFLAVSDDGTWVAVWESNDTLAKGVGEDTDLLFARSMDGGETWSPAQILNSDAANDGGAQPIGNDGGARLLSLEDGKWLATWHRYLGGGGAELLFSRSVNNGVSWTPPAVIDNPAGGSKSEENGAIGLYILGPGLGWIAPDGTSPGEKLYYGIGYGDKSVRKPKVQLSGNDYDLRGYFTDADGKRWTNPEIALPNAFTDSKDDDEPVLAADGKGHIVLVWYSFDSLGGTIGTDADILFSTATIGGVTELLTPNGGETWKRGKKKKIEWVTNVDPAEDVRLDLLRNGSKVKTISNATPNDGSFKWKVPDNLDKGGGYQVEITANNDTAIRDESLYEFKVK